MNHNETYESNSKQAKLRFMLCALCRTTPLYSQLCFCATLAK